MVRPTALARCSAARNALPAFCLPALRLAATLRLQYSTLTHMRAVGAERASIALAPPFALLSHEPALQ